MLFVSLGFLFFGIFGLWLFIRKVRRDPSHWRQLGNTTNLIGLWLILFADDLLPLKQNGTGQIMLGVFGVFIMIGGFWLGYKKHAQYSRSL